MKTLGEFRKLTASLPDSTRLLTNAPDQYYREIGGCVLRPITHICAAYAPLDPDYGDDPELYRRTVVVIE